MCSHANASAYSLCNAVVLQKYFVHQVTMISMGPTYYVCLYCLGYRAGKSQVFCAYYIATCDLSAIFLHIISYTARFRGGGEIECGMRVLIFCTTFVWNISHSRKNWARYHKYIGSHVKYPLFLSDFNETWMFSEDFRKILKCQIAWKYVQWEPSCSMRKDRYEVANSFSSFANAPKYVSKTGCLP
jgi:hypothetical protein